MSAKTQTIKEFAEHAFKLVENAVSGVTEPEALYRATDESNNIYWIINHVCRISNTTLPRIIRGDPSWKPVGWPDDYKDQRYGLDKYRADLAAGKKMVLDGIAGLTDVQLEEEAPFRGGKARRATGLITYLGELVHHEGQIMFIRGTVKRLKEKNPHVLDL